MAQAKHTSDYVFCIRRQVVDISAHSCHTAVLDCTVACQSPTDEALVTEQKRNKKSRLSDCGGSRKL